MFDPDQYQLLDFGDGRKLERFGDAVLDRTSPAAADASVIHSELWSNATARFELVKGSKGEWVGDVSRLSADDADRHGEPCVVNHGGSRLIVGVNGAGNVGLFPEQAGNWDWIVEQVSLCQQALPARAPRVLNLFAYTGGATLAAASAGAEVAHIDSSGPTVQWAKRNAATSGMDDLPIRWLVDDAMKFAAREIKRGNFYDGVIADPPTYGHGPKGKAFKFQQHVDDLMQLCGRLVSGYEPGHRFMLFSCHAPGFGRDEAQDVLGEVVPNTPHGQLNSGPLLLESSDGRNLAAGVFARWSASFGREA